MAHPKLAGQIILQDRVETIKSTPEIKGVKFTAHDFFTPQTVKGTVTSILFKPE